jgi:hypothetical protein
MEAGKGEQGRKEFPRTYRTAKSARHFFNRFAVFMLVLFGVLTLLHLTGRMAHPLSRRDLALMDGLVASFAIWTGQRANRRVILHEDAIEVSGWWSKRRLGRGEIRAFRMGKLPVLAGGGSYYVVVPRDAAKGELKLPPLLHTDSVFLEWISAIPASIRRENPD